VKTEFQVLHRPRSDVQSCGVAGQFATVEQAREFAGYPQPDLWKTINGSFYLNDAITARIGRELLYMIVPVDVAETDAERIEFAIHMAMDYGSTDEPHHKQWALDQVVRILTGDRYDEVVREWCAGEDGPDTYSWDEGIAP
jgi:hypothetical protein